MLELWGVGCADIKSHSMHTAARSQLIYTGVRKSHIPMTFAPRKGTHFFFRCHKMKRRGRMVSDGTVARS